MKDQPKKKDLFKVLLPDQGEVEYLSNQKLKKRTCENQALSSFTANTWCQYVSQTYREIFEEKYPNYPEKIRYESNMLVNFIYPTVFDLHGFSARDFKDLINISIKKCKSKNSKFFLGNLKTEYGKKQILTFQRKLLAKRQEDLFEKIVHLPHKAISDDPDDLFLIIDSTPMTSVQFMANYGLCIYHKYLQLSKPTSFEEATKLVRRSLLDDVLIKYKNNLPVLKSIMSMIAQNTIAWEPYTASEIKDGIPACGFIYLDWRKEFNSIFEKLGLKYEPWWKSRNVTSNLHPLKSVNKLFSMKECSKLA